MRKITLLILALVALSTVSGQVLPKEEVITNSKPTHFSVGVFGGYDRNYHLVDVSYMAEYKYSKFAPGLSYGLSLGYSPWSWLTLRADGVMVEKNYYRDHVATQVGQSYPDTTVNQYLNVPLVLMLNVGKTFRLHAFGGGYVGYWLSSHRTGRSMGVFGNPAYDTEVDFISPESQVRDNRRDLGFTYGGGVSLVIKRHLEVGVELRWYYGTEDIQKPYMTNLNPRYNTTMVMQGGINYLF